MKYLSALLFYAREKEAARLFANKNIALSQIKV
jgi:hypothetical protein